MHEALAGLMAAPLAAFMAVVAGAALGLVFYAGLWWTVRRAATFRLPGPSVLASFLLRMGVTLGGFYLVAAGDAVRLLLCLLGFVLGRAAVSWFTRQPSSAGGPVIATGDTRHAP